MVNIRQHIDGTANRFCSGSHRTLVLLRVFKYGYQNSCLPGEGIRCTMNILFFILAIMEVSILFSGRFESARNEAIEK